MATTTVSFCEAIARKEGWLVSLSRCRRNNNPGNLNFASWEVRNFNAILEPKTPSVLRPRFARFVTAQEGFNAMAFLLQEHYMGKMLSPIIYDWAPPTDGNNTPQYVLDICEWTGYTPQTVMTVELLHAPTVQVA